MSDDLICVYAAGSVEEADIVAAWLGARGIEAHVKERNVLGLELGPLSTFQRGVPVCVVDGETADRARVLLAEREHAEANDQAAVGSVTALCEECGETSEFPVTQQGTVQDCPHCHKYIDVPE